MDSFEVLKTPTNLLHLFPDSMHFQLSNFFPLRIHFVPMNKTHQFIHLSIINQFVSMSQFKQIFSLIVPTLKVAELTSAQPRLICDVSYFLKTAITCRN